MCLDVYKIVPKKPYFYGCALVAATSEKEAISVFRKVSDYNSILYDDGNCVCEMIVGLEYNTNAPCIILDTVDEE